MSDDPYLKCVVIGDGAVGKTCMLMCFVNNAFPEEYVPTVFDNYSTPVMYKEKKVTLNLFDTAGQTDYDDLRPMAYPDTNVFLLCFSIVEPASLMNIKDKWYPELCEHNCKKIPMIMVGCKSDLRGDKDVEEELAKRDETVITTERAMEVKRAIKSLDCIECSAKTQEGMKEVFDAVVKAYMEPPVPDGKKCCTIL